MMVKRVRVVFPPGSAGLLRVWVEYLGDKLWPYNPDGEWRGDDHVIEFAPNLDLVAEPTILRFAGYNLDDTYPHEATLELDVEFMGQPIPSRDLLSQALALGPQGPPVAPLEELNA